MELYSDVVMIVRKGEKADPEIKALIEEATKLNVEIVEKDDNTFDRYIALLNDGSYLA